MTVTQLYKEIESLPEDLQEQVSDFVAFLKSKVKQKVGNNKIKERKPGSLKGKIKMSDDFDEPLEEFKEYM